MGCSPISRAHSVAKASKQSLEETLKEAQAHDLQVWQIDIVQQEISQQKLVMNSNGVSHSRSFRGDWNP